MMLKNMKIGKRLMLTFILVAIISGIGGCVGYAVMTKLNAEYTNALENYGFAQGDIGRLSAEFNSARAVTRDIVIYTDVHKIQETETKLNESSMLINHYLTQIQKEMVSEKEKSYYNAISNDIASYNEARARGVALAKQNKKTEAQDLLTNEAGPISTKLSTEINNLLNSKTEEGNQLAQQLAKQMQIARIAIISIILLSFIISVLIALRIAKSISKPITEMKEAAQRMADGDLNSQIAIDSKNEIGMLGQAFSQSVSSINMYISDIQRNLHEVELGNLTVKSQIDYIGDYSNLKKSLEGIIAFFNDTLVSINQASEQVSSGAEQVASGAQALAQGATEQASSVEELSASITEISTHIKDNARHAVSASKNVSDVSDEIEVSNQHMGEMLGAMNRISESSNEIGKIIKTIEDIAFQTNILALNAAVEAARAGAAGKGFAVVADEVRNLASKSAEAAKDTTSLIENSIRQVESGTKIADETAQSLQRVVKSAEVVSETVAKIADATNRQSDAINQVTIGVEQISSVVQTNSATAEESAAASEELSGQAKVLKELVSKFKLSDTGNRAALPAGASQETFQETKPEPDNLDQTAGKY
ncbi:methyl-accepting chemotaxis protein [Caproiciproducens galactitolivorans]|nr:methyl-accepting chemotaxis protein [Caproiciproducens galactitolivorans]